MSTPRLRRSLRVLLPCLTTSLAFSSAWAQFADVTPPALTDSLTGYGAAWADIDGDGDHDLYFANLDGPNRLFRNDGGNFVDITAGPAGDAGAGTGVAFADYDGDGDLDLYLAKFGPNRLARNDHGGWAIETYDEPIADPNSGGGVAWADYDLDGDLDLYLSNFGQANRLMRNEGAGVFADATAFPLDNTDVGECVTWGDFDGDGDPDLFLANRGQPNLLARNEGGGVFSDATNAALADSGRSQGAAWGDYDNDGDLDLYVCNSDQPNHLYRNDGGVFVDVTTPPLDDTNNGHGAAWADFDNDGDLDLFVANDGQENKLFRNDGGEFVDVGVGYGAVDFTKGVAGGDYDLDGDVDLYLTNIGANTLLRNDWADGTGNHWLQVDLQGRGMNTYGIGARVIAVDGARRQLREVRCGSGYLSQDSLTAEFGLGAATIVDSLLVRWPSGEWQVLENVVADQRVKLYEPVVTASSEPGVRSPLRGTLAPNPFNPRTVLRLKASVEGPLRVEVVDIAGRRIAVLFDDFVTAGLHEISWNGRDEQGQRVASGIYRIHAISAEGELSRGGVLVE